MKKEILKDVNVCSINPYERNYLDHSKNINHIINSIKDFGYNKVSIGIDENNVLLYGHGTLEALKELKYEHVPFIMKIDGLKDKEKKAYRIADNASANRSEIISDLLNIEMEDIAGEFDMSSYGLDLQEPFISDDLIEEVNRGDENSEWVGMHDFQEGEGYTRVMLHFNSEEERESFVEKHSLAIVSRNKGQWVCRA